MTYTREDFVTAIKNYDEETIIKYVDNGLVDQHDEELINLAVATRNLTAFGLLIDTVEVEDRNILFAKSVDYYLPIALVLVEKSNFESMTNHTDNLTYWENTQFFPEESCLPSFFPSRKFSNNKEAYVAQILSNSVNSTGIGEDDLLVFNYLIENRKEFNIADEQIVQHVVENNYKLKVFQPFGVKSKDSSTEFFVKIINKLAQENVDLSSDQHGLLIQIAAMNGLKEVLPTLINQGSSMNGFMERYANKDNWLSDEGLEEMYNEADYNYERQYDIEKKFDDKNLLKEDMLILCETLKNSNTTKPKMKM